MKRTVYFAHSKLIYNTPLEKGIIKMLEDAGYEVLDPNSQLGELGDIAPYLAAIDTCDETIVFPHHDYIGKGVYEEVAHTIRTHKFCFRFVPNSRSPHGFNLKEITGVRVYEITDWKWKYGKLIY